MTEPIGSSQSRLLTRLYRWDLFSREVREEHYRAKYGPDWQTRFMTRAEKSHYTRHEKLTVGRLWRYHLPIVYYPRCVSLFNCLKRPIPKKHP